MTCKQQHSHVHIQQHATFCSCKDLSFLPSSIIMSVTLLLIHQNKTARGFKNQKPILCSSSSSSTSFSSQVASKMPGLTIGDTLPDLEVETTHGKIKLHLFCADSWTILFSHPGDFTPVCTTELGKMAQYSSEFYQRGVKLIGLSCDDIESHKEWIKDIEAYTPGAKVNYPIIADPSREIIKQLNMVDPDEKDSTGNLPSRALHIVGPDKKIKLSFMYPATTGRNMDEVVRVLESLQKASKFKVATPANWKPGDKVAISPGVTNEQAKEMFLQGFETVDLPSKKEYLRFTEV